MTLRFGYNQTEGFSLLRGFRHVSVSLSGVLMRAARTGLCLPRAQMLRARELTFVCLFTRTNPFAFIFHLHHSSDCNAVSTS